MYFFLNCFVIMNSVQSSILNPSVQEGFKRAVDQFKSCFSWDNQNRNWIHIIGFGAILILFIWAVVNRTYSVILTLGFVGFVFYLSVSSTPTKDNFSCKDLKEDQDIVLSDEDLCDDFMRIVDSENELARKKLSMNHNGSCMDVKEMKVDVCGDRRAFAEGLIGY